MSNCELECKFERTRIRAKSEVLVGFDLSPSICCGAPVCTVSDLSHFIICTYVRCS